MIDGPSKCVGRFEVGERGDMKSSYWDILSPCACGPYRWKCIIGGWLYKPGLCEGGQD